ncbi:MAG: glycosyltransferase family 2 protein [Desulfurococcales archaeon]|nr:glycosyltransferase family 2 protein [Desulfurococcales archaeon]
MKKVLLVIMNKDNAEGLRRCLESLGKQKVCELCNCFDVLILDGGSGDESADVAYEFAEKYPCVKFKVQEVRGGVGPARVEAVRYAIDNGYEVVIWGDSENEYSDTYVANLISAVSESCDVASGRSIVRDESVWSRLFFWYHNFHVIFKSVRASHAPGNNEATRIDVFKSVIYPPISRADDFYFSLLALTRGTRFCYSDDAVIKVSMPKTFKEVMAWQKARVRGVVEGAIATGLKVPIDFPLWFLFAVSPGIAALLIYLILIFSYPLVVVPAALLAFYIAALAKTALSVGLSSVKCVENPSLASGLSALAGMYLHAVFTLVYGVKYLIKLGARGDEVLAKVEKVLERFNFSLDMIRLKLKDLVGRLVSPK